MCGRCGVLNGRWHGAIWRCSSCPAASWSSLSCPAGGGFGCPAPFSWRLWRCVLSCPHVMPSVAFCAFSDRHFARSLRYMPASASVASALVVGLLSAVWPLLHSTLPSERHLEEVVASPSLGVHLHAPAYHFSLGGGESCPEPEPCAVALPPHRAALRWLALYPGWAPEIAVGGLFALLIIGLVVRRCASRRLRRRPVVRYAGRVVPAAHARPALLG